MNSSSASPWRAQAFKIISYKLKLHAHEYEEMQLLKLKADSLKDLRKKILREKFD